MQLSDEMRSQTYFMNARLDGFEADGLPDERPANETQAPLPFEVAMEDDAAHRPMVGINQRREAFGTASRTDSIP
jgi:hypothetical protein